MEKRLRTLNIGLAIVIFILLPIAIYFMGDFPLRSNYKEIISIVTIISLFIMLLQFFMSRANKRLLSAHKMTSVINWHKVFGYVFTGVLIFHPFFVLLPKYLEPGLGFSDSFSTLIDEILNSRALQYGLLAYILMIVIGLTSYFRDHLAMSFKTWKLLHGLLSISFIVFACSHVTEIGRHMNSSMKILIYLLSISAIILMLNSYYKSLKIRKDHGE